MQPHSGHGWYYWDASDDSPKGPFAPATIRDKVTDRTLTLSSMVWHETQSPYYTPISALAAIGLAQPVQPVPPPLNVKPSPFPSDYAPPARPTHRAGASADFSARGPPPPAGQSFRLSKTVSGASSSTGTDSASRSPKPGERSPKQMDASPSTPGRLPPRGLVPPPMRVRQSLGEHKAFAGLRGESSGLTSASSVSLMSDYQRYDREVKPKPHIVSGGPHAIKAKVACDFLITREGKLGLKQELLMVLQEGKFLVVDREKRSTVKDYDVLAKQVTSVTIPPTKDETFSSPCTLEFHSDTKLKPLTVSFTDFDERLLFTQELSTMNPSLEVKDNSEKGDEREILRFAICKSNMGGIINTRIVALITSTRSLVSYAKNKKPKVMLLRDVNKVERCYDKRKCDLFFDTRPPVHFQFLDAASREKFLGRLNYLWDLAILEKECGNGVMQWVDPRKIRVFSISWNCGGSSPPPPDILRLCFGNAGDHDLYIINLQECSKKRDLWGSAIKAHCETSGTSLEVLSTVRLWDMVLLILIKEQLARFISHVEADTIACGIGDVLGNKGGIAVSFHIRDTSFCVVNCHFAARAERLAQRQGNFIRIVQSLQLGLKSYDILNQFHHVIWSGDLNYRIDADFHKTIEDMNNRNFAPLIAADQLTNEMAQLKVLAGFKEGPLNFAPTYRWDRHTTEVSNKREQTPSWTDRILWRSFANTEDELTFLSYRSIPDAYGSDHRPVIATFSLQPRIAYAGTQLYSVATHNAQNRKHCEVQLSQPRAFIISTDLIDQEKEQLNLVFTSTILDQSVSPPPLAFTAGVTNCWAWGNDVGALKLSPFVFDKEVLMTSHFLVSLSIASAAKELYFGEGAQGIEDTKVEVEKGAVGCAVIPLSVVFDRDSKFSVQITKGGQVVGTFTGNLAIKEMGTVDLAELSDIRISRAFSSTHAQARPNSTPTLAKSPVQSVASLRSAPITGGPAPFRLPAR